MHTLSYPMADLLVKLYELPVPSLPEGYVIRSALAPEKHKILEWIGTRFQQSWVSEADVCFSRQPVSCIIAVSREGQLVGFACYDATMRGFFGPTGVDEALRGKGVGKALYLHTLHAMRNIGYGYAVVGSAGPTAFYEKAANAMVIPGSSPGIYKGML